MILVLVITRLQSVMELYNDDDDDDFIVKTTTTTITMMMIMMMTMIMMAMACAGVACRLGSDGEDDGIWYWR